MNIILESTGCFLFFLEHFLLAENSYYYRHRQSPNFAFLAAKACHYFFATIWSTNFCVVDTCEGIIVHLGIEEKES